MYRLHFTLLILLMADGILYFGAGLSYRGQWPDILVLSGPALTALWLVIRSGRKMIKGLKIYFGALLILYMLSVPLLFLSTALVLHRTYAEADGYEARALPGMLAFEGVQIIRKRFLFEEVVSDQIGCELGAKGAIVFKPDSVGVTVRNGTDWDTVFAMR